jgi:intracellular sulfur oxidation DsrE/DsrF family protein
MAYKTDRRSVIGGVLLAGAGAAASSPAIAKGTGTAAAADWQPAMEAMDAWLDKPSARHRMLFDSTSIESGVDALGFANNFIHLNETAYNLTPEQLGVVVVLRHFSTPLAYNNSVWAKYGKGLVEKLGIKGELATRAATVNPVLATSARPQTPPGFEWFADDSLSKLADKGVRYAVCGLATQVLAGMLAGPGGNAKAVDAELRSNLVPGALIVPAGIVAVNRAQEHGYSFAYVA